MSQTRRLRRWIAARRADWNRITEESRNALRGRLPLPDAQRAVRDYRGLASDLAVARRDLAGTDLVPRLEGLLHQLHVAIHSHGEPWREQLRRLYGVEVPRVFAELKPALHAVVLIFLCAAIASWLLVSTYPELAALVLPEEAIRNVQHGELWTEGILNVEPGALIATGIATNNIVVSLTAFVLGAFYGIGTLYMVINNGLMIGGVLAFTHSYGLMERMTKFMFAHGVVELSVAAIACAAGVKLGEALARPGNRPRGEAFRAAVADAGKLLCVVVPALLVTGIIEGNISPDPDIGWPVRIAVGAMSGFLLWTVLTGRAVRKPRAA
jgi:uncharacterized membrane protein SpoIIM required for sporulation